MHLYKQFWKLVGRNKQGIILYSIITAIMLIVVCVAVKDEGKRADEDGGVIIGESLDISYVDNDNSELSKAFIQYLSKDNNVIDYSGQSEETINNQLYFEVITFHIDIPEGFQNRLDNGENVNVEYTTSLGQSAYVYKIENVINSYSNIYSMFVEQGCSPTEAIEKTNDAMNQEINISVYASSDKPLSGSSKEYVVYFLSLYITYLSFGMIAMSVGKSIITSSDDTVAARIGAAPVSETKLSLINTAGLYSFSILLLIVYAIGIYVFAGDTTLVREKGVLLIINTFIALLYNSSLTSIIASFKVRGNVLSMIVNILGLSMSFLCGVFVPMWLLGDEVLNVARFLPFYWTTSTLSMIYPECGAGYTFDSAKIYGNFGIALMYVIVFAVVAVLVKKLKKK